MINFARYSGYEVDVRNKAHHYKIKVAEGVRGVNIPVTAVLEDDGKWYISFNGTRLTVVSVEQIV